MGQLKSFLSIDEISESESDTDSIILQLFNGIVKMLSETMQAKSPNTSKHSQRVPELSIMLAESLQNQNCGKYANFELNDKEKQAFYLAAWLHDCGKLAIPEHILEKATKLELVYNRIHEIRTRFEVLWRDCEIKYLKSIKTGQDNSHAFNLFLNEQKSLLDDFKLVASVNNGKVSVTPEIKEKLHNIGSRTWLRNFDDSLGLSPEEEKQRLKSRYKSQKLPMLENLLMDREYHKISWRENKPPVGSEDPTNHFGFNMIASKYQQNAGELHNLSIERGTLTPEDRFVINTHAAQTLIMLKKLPWPTWLKGVPDMAANHHERMDGLGYPRRLFAADLPLSHRIIAVADVFEALTAPDRPYKKGNTVFESLLIMAKMCRNGHLDTDLFDYFLTNKVWFKFAKKYLKPEQIDNVDYEQINSIFKVAH